MLKNKVQNAQLAALFALAGVVSAPPALAQSYDERGCRTLVHGCAQARSRWDEDSDTVTITTVTNRCGERIAIRLCKETENNGSSKWICHNYGLSDGESIDQTTFFSTGEYEFDYIGSRSSATDSACLGSRRN